MNKSNQNIKFLGNSVTVRGCELKEGAKLPEFKLVGQDLKDIVNSNFAGKVLVISVVPSLDTPTCSLQTKRFNQEAEKLGGGVAILTVSRDLPFAQARWCGAEGVKSVVTASDYKYRTFGETFGVELPDMGLLARAVFVVGTDGKIEYLEYVPNISEEPEYEPILTKIKELSSR